MLAPSRSPSLPDNARLERQQVAILAGNLPNTKHDSAVGRFMFNMVVSAAQFQRDLDSERRTSMMRRTFEEGGHRGNDPLGYHSARDEAGKVAKPRALVVDSEEAVVVRRVFALLRDHSFSDAAAVLNREGARHRSPKPWATSAVKDILRRRDLYRGNVTTKRGLESRPGRHEAILADAEVRDAVAGVASRLRHTDRSPAHSKRVYALRGLAFCDCGARLRGDTRSSRGRSWSYYCCPVSDGRTTIAGPDGELIECHAGRVPAPVAETLVLSALSELAVPEETVAAARAELVRRLRAKMPGVADRERERLTARLTRLNETYGWLKLTEQEYLAQRAGAEAALAALPDHESKLIAFDAAHAVVKSLPEAIEGASRERLQQLLALTVERVECADRAVARVTWRPEVRPFLTSVEDDAGFGRVRPRTDSSPRQANESTRSHGTRRSTLWPLSTGSSPKPTGDALAR